MAGPSQLEGVRSAKDVLSEAAERVSRALGEDGVPDALAEFHEALIGAVAGKLADSLDALPTEIASHARCGAMLDTLTHAVVSVEASHASPGAAMTVLHAIHELRTRRGDPDDGVGGPGADLEHRLRSPDAFELLVEVAHDFRSPLASILFLAETLRNENSGPVTDQQRSQLGLVYSAAFGLASIASDVMDLARDGRGLVEGPPEPYAFSDIFSGVDQLVRPLVEEKSLRLVIESPGHGGGRGYRQALHRVMLNLTTNAIKYTDEGVVEIGVHPLRSGGLRYYVQDTGRGIPPERQADLFQPFKKRRLTADAGHFFSGSGVGLSITRRLVRAMGGDLSMETSDAAGTRFWFDLPPGPA